MNANIKKYIPADGLAGLKENFKADAISGFIVFLLALPLSLGIAKASDFPPIMGLITAIIGGIVVSFFMGSRLTIKGPAAGLIVIVAGAVAEFGQGNNELGWKLALGAMVVAGVIQILFGVLKLGKLADFFPLSAIHGMLAAIGIIIIAKQIPVLLNDNPTLAKGKGHRFDGEFVCEGFFQSEQADKDGDLRSTIVFRLSRIEAITDDALNRLPSEHNEFPLESDLIAARNAALSVTQRAPRINPSVSKRNIYQRSRVVAHYVIMRSKGVCESCSTNAPFLKVDGKP